MHKQTDYEAEQRRLDGLAHGRIPPQQKPYLIDGFLTETAPRLPRR